MAKSISFKKKKRRRKTPYEKAGIKFDKETRKVKKEGSNIRVKSTKKKKVVSVWCNTKELEFLNKLMVSQGFDGHSETIKWALGVAKNNLIAKEFREMEAAKLIIAQGLDINSVKRKWEKLKKP